MARRLFGVGGDTFALFVWLVFYNKVFVTDEVPQKTTLCSKMAFGAL